MWWSSGSGTSRLIGSIRYQAGVQHSVIWFKKLVITWGQYLNHSEGEKSRSACSECFNLRAQSRPARISITSSASLSFSLPYFTSSSPSSSSLPPLFTFIYFHFPSFVAPLLLSVFKGSSSRIDVYAKSLTAFCLYEYLRCCSCALQTFLQTFCPKYVRL